MAAGRASTVPKASPPVPVPGRREGPQCVFGEGGVVVVVVVKEGIGREEDE